MNRPNAIDFRVDQLPVHDLLTRPAAALVDPERQIAALRLVHWYLPAWFALVLFPVVALYYLWQSGTAARVRDALRERLRDESLVRFCFGAFLGAVVRLSGLLPAFSIYRVQRLMSLSDELLRAWFGDWLLASLATMLVMGIVTALVLAIAQRTHQWYIYTMLGIFAFAFGLAYAAPFVAAPAFDRIVPLSPRAQAVARAVERRAGVRMPIVEEVRRRSHLEVAYPIGFGATERIVLGDAVFAVASAAELRYDMALELGYAADGATLKIALTDALLLIFGAAVGVAVADRIRFRRDDDPLTRLALLGALLGLIYFIAVPIDNAVLRAIDARARSYALTLGVDKAAAVRSVVRTTDERLNEVCPDVLARTFIARTIDASTAVSEITGVPRACP
jgi:hypothetical protein